MLIVFIHFAMTMCSINQNFASVIFRGYMNATSVDSILPQYLSRVPKFGLDTFNFSLGNFSRVSQFCLGFLDLASKLPRVSTLMLHPARQHLSFKTIQAWASLYFEIHFLDSFICCELNRIFRVSIPLNMDLIAKILYFDSAPFLHLIDLRLMSVKYENHLWCEARFMK